MAECRVCRGITKSATGYHARCWSGLSKDQRAEERQRLLMLEAAAAERVVIVNLGRTGLAETPAALASRLQIEKRVVKQALDNLAGESRCAALGKKYFPIEWYTDGVKSNVAS